LEQVLQSKKKASVSSIITIIVVGIFGLIFLFPFYWMVTGSFKLQSVAMQIPPQWFPLHPSLVNWIKLFKFPAGLWTFNGVFIAVVSMILICFTSAMAGYSLAKKQFPGRMIIFWMFMATMTLPKQVLMVPLYTMMSQLGWINTYQGLIFPAIGWPFGIFLMKQFMQTMPTEMISAARIDGCGEFKIFTRIVLPLVKPGLGALAIFTFMSSWNDYFWQLIMINNDWMKTIPIGVAGLQMENSTDYGLIMAGSTLASVPMIAIFLLFQKYFTQGIMMGAVKG
jgi:multiple sugar transport system permease protein